MSEVQVDALVQKWLDVDPNPVTRAQVEELQKDGNIKELTNILGKRILFGTAGLRSKMEAGFNRLNDVTILQSSQGLAQYMIDCNKGSLENSVVIGHDHRHNSKKFAELTAVAFLQKGFKVYYLGDDSEGEGEGGGSGLVATPLVPFAVDFFKALGGVMITASHNPAQDNGYKVYWKNGCQIINPHDINIQNYILLNLEIDKSHWNRKDIIKTFYKKEKLLYSRDLIIKKYLSSINSKLIKTKLNEDLKAVYTPMHGVGQEFIEMIMDELLSPNKQVLWFVEEQKLPNPDFPTVLFPNPEEKGAMKLGQDTADSFGIELVISNDPDADRFSCCIKDKKGKWIQLTGNEIGFLFAYYVIKIETDSSNELNKVYLLNSTVSSQLIKSMAKIEGFNYEDTLTGFKWIGNKAIELEDKGFKVPFAYEEAIGYMFNLVHDKDGISALVVFLQMYSYWLGKGKNLIEVLNEEIYSKYGFFKECNGYYLVPDLSITSKIFNENIRIGGKNFEHPKKLGNYEVVEWRDLTIGYDSSTVDKKPKMFVDPTSEMITVLLKNGDGNEEFIRFTARGSGTEPKLKVYIESKSSDLKKAEFLSQDVWELLKKLWFKPDKYNLKEVK